MRYSRYIAGYLKMADIVMAFLAMHIAMLLRFGSVQKLYDQRYLIMFLGLVISWLLLARVNKLYRFTRFTPWHKIGLNYAKTAGMQLLLLLAASTVVKAHFLSRELVLYYFVILTFSHQLSNYLFHRFLIYIRKKGQNYRTVAVLGKSTASTDFVTDVLSKPEYGFRFKGFFQEVAEGGVDSWNSFMKMADEEHIDQLFCTLTELQKLGIDEVLDYCARKRIRVRFLSEVMNHLRKRENARLEIAQTYAVPMVVLRPEPLNRFQNRAIKRGFDFVVAGILLVALFSWLYPLCTLLIKLSSKGPVFFRQRRKGIDGKEFDCIKFRTMHVNTNDVQATADDPRIFGLGNILRKLHIDEIPQLLNVIKGEMSLVGPRPHPVWLDEVYKEELSNYSIRHFVKPGITGLAQSKGYHGETKQFDLMKRRVDFDLHYIQNWSIWLDIDILASTAKNVLLGKPEVK